ncbi:MAG TPA: lactate racemase domain-containing protein, partial [Candidatus Limnocylindrales bacterium]
MTNPAYHVPYGRGQLAFDLPAGLTGRVLESHSVPALVDPVAAVTIALKSPVAGPCLAALARPGNRVTIVVTDSTRACP